MTSEIKQLIEWIAEKSEGESAFLTSFPVWNINSHALLDEIVNIFNLSKEEVGKIVNKEV